MTAVPLDRILVPVVPMRPGESLHRRLPFANDRQPVYLYLDTTHGPGAGLLWLDWSRDHAPSLARRLASGEVLRWAAKPWTRETANSLLIDPRVQSAAARIVASPADPDADAELSALAWSFDGGIEEATP